MSIQRNGIKFYKGKLDFCEMLDYRQSDTFISIKMNGEKLMCPVQPVIWFDLKCFLKLTPNIQI